MATNPANRRGVPYYSSTMRSRFQPASVHASYNNYRGYNRPAALQVTHSKVVAPVFESLPQGASARAHAARGVVSRSVPAVRSGVVSRSVPAVRSGGSHNSSDMKHR